MMFAWPLRTLDLEASAFGPRSYPIEAAVAIWREPTRPIEVWAGLIRPTAAWSESGRWDETSAQVHGISKEELSNGIAVDLAAPRLNALAGAGAVLSDAVALDDHWLARLFDAAGEERTFRIDPIEDAVGRLDAAQWQRHKRFLDRNPSRHRAGDDATRLLIALARGIKAKVEVVRRDLADAPTLQPKPR